MDPIGVAGGYSQYGYAGGDPVNFSDPFGLCPPEDNDPCNMNTGDPNLDNADSRNQMERGYKNAGTDAGGYRLEAGGVCYVDGECVSGKNATRENIDLASDPRRKAKYDWHTHGNVGRTRESGVPGDVYTAGASTPDIEGAEMVYNSPLLKMFGNNLYPSYIVDDKYIYRITPGADGKAQIATFNRWKTP